MSNQAKRSASASSSSQPFTKRILTELRAFQTSPPPPTSGIVSLVPSTSNLSTLSAILASPTFPTPYDTGRWQLTLAIPPSYPMQPPSITFRTPICHPNVDFATGAICLDVLGENWTPILGVVGALECVARLLGEPGTDSPLGVEIAALWRGGDHVGARGLVGFWCGEVRFEGDLDAGGDGDGYVGEVGFGEEGRR